MSQVTDKVVVITGASQGIGAGLVSGYLRLGYRVVANSRSIKPDASADVLAVAGDITDPAVAARVIGSAVEKFGRLEQQPVGLLIGDGPVFNAPRDDQELAFFEPDVTIPE